MFDFLTRKEAKVENRNISVASTVWSFLSGNAPSDYMSIGTVYACIRMISDSVAMTPLNVYQKTDDGRDQLEDDALKKLIQNPAPYTTYFQWMDAMLAQTVGWGNGYSVIERDGNTAISLIYIPSANVGIYTTNSKTDPYYYKVTMSDNTTINVFPDDMVHFRNITLDGYTGLSPIGLHSSTFDRAFHEGEFATNYVKNSGSMSGIITSDKRLKPEQVKQLKEDFGTAYSGSENAGKTPVLVDGMQYTQLKPISPADADYVRSKELTKAEVMEIFKVPPPLLGVIDATYNNTEQLALIYQRYTLSPIYTMIQQEMTLKLVNDVKQGTIYYEFESDALLNATAKDKAEVITKLTEKGVMSLNEARRKYNLKDKTGLDDVVLPLNSAPMALHEKVLTPVEPAPVPTPEPVPEPETPDTEAMERAIHKVQSDLGRLKKQLGNRNP